MGDQPVKEEQEKQQPFFSLEFSGLPPTINSFYCRSRHNVYKSPEAREWQQQTAEDIADKWQDKPPYSGRIELRITYFIGNHRKWDIDNRVKVLQDCLEMAGVIENDSQIDSLIVRREYRKGIREITKISLLEYKEGL